jgi:hypothetical protein
MKINKKNFLRPFCNFIIYCALKFNILRISSSYDVVFSALCTLRYKLFLQNMQYKYMGISWKTPYNAFKTLIILSGYTLTGVCSGMVFAYAR